MPRTHELGYRAGLVGLGRAQSTEPAWYCTCGEWCFRAQAMPRRKAGNNSIEAHRSYAEHVRSSS